MWQWLSVVCSFIHLFNSRLNIVCEQSFRHQELARNKAKARSYTYKAIEKTDNRVSKRTCCVWGVSGMPLGTE